MLRTPVQSLPLNSQQANTALLTNRQWTARAGEGSAPPGGVACIPFLFPLKKKKRAKTKTESQRQGPWREGRREAGRGIGIACFLHPPTSTPIAAMTSLLSLSDRRGRLRKKWPQDAKFNYDVRELEQERMQAPAARSPDVNSSAARRLDTDCWCLFVITSCCHGFGAVERPSRESRWCRGGL